MKFTCQFCRFLARTFRQLVQSQTRSLSKESVQDNVIRGTFKVSLTLSGRSPEPTPTKPNDLGVTTRGEGSAGAKTGPSGARTPPVASRQSTGSTEHMLTDLLDEAARREGLPGRGSEVGKFWGSGEGVGGGLNFTLSDI